ncbi:autotransporter-associated beta strand repeat-containing protein, partial [Haloferula sp.]|uniref:autotransporter-associated beta strand repeat-containing protein n=1 Tax=Haloferula sp. TaxID=2497595 RepID=UPI003C7359BC
SGVSSAAGAGSAILLGASGTGTPGNLVYTGTGHSTNRAIDLVSTGSSFPSLSANGSGPVTFSGTFSNAATVGNTKTLRLAGSNSGANTISSALSDGAGGGTLALLKQETGTWVLTSSNSFTGDTTVNEGTLQIGNGGTTGTLPNTSAITVLAGGTLCFNRSNTVLQGTDFTSTAIAGGGTVEIKGGGTLRLNQTDSFTSGIHLVVATGSTLHLDFEGAETVASLTLGGDEAAAGSTHDAVSDPTFISGGGAITVQAEPVAGVPNIISIVRDGSGDVIITLDAPADGLTVQQSNDLSDGSFADIASSAVGSVITISAANTDPNADGKDFYRIRN